METADNMNVREAQNTAASTPASSVTASTAAAQATHITSSRSFNPSKLPLRNPLLLQAPPAAVDLTAAATGANMTATASPHQTHPVGDRCAITPLS